MQKLKVKLLTVDVVSQTQSTGLLNKNTGSTPKQETLRKNNTVCVFKVCVLSLKPRIVSYGVLTYGVIVFNLPVVNVHNYLNFG